MKVLLVNLHVNSILIKTVFFYFRNDLAILFNTIQDWAMKGEGKKSPTTSFSTEISPKEGVSSQNFLNLVVTHLSHYYKI